MGGSPVSSHRTLRQPAAIARKKFFLAQKNLAVASDRLREARQECVASGNDPEAITRLVEAITVFVARRKKAEEAQ